MKNILYLKFQKIERAIHVHQKNLRYLQIQVVDTFLAKNNTVCILSSSAKSIKVKPCISYIIDIPHTSVKNVLYIVPSLIDHKKKIYITISPFLSVYFFFLYFGFCFYVDVLCMKDMLLVKYH